MKRALRFASLKGSIRTSLAASCLALLIVAGNSPSTAALTNPGSGSVGLEAKIGADAPSKAASISTPSNGQTFTTTPVTVSGLCTTGLLVKVFTNNVFVGATQCVAGSYSLKVDLFSGQNDIVVRVYDSLDQAGPDSNVVRVNFNDAQFAQFGSRVSLSSSYAKLGANPGDTLEWPLILSGGNGPYAISVDWGDGTASDLMSEPFAGNFSIHHVFATAGIYNVIVKATDQHNVAAYLQLVGVANGKVIQGATSGGSTSNNSSGGSTASKPKVLWYPLAGALPLLVASFWLGQRHELFSIRKQLERSRTEQY